MCAPFVWSKISFSEFFWISPTKKFKVRNDEKKLNYLVDDWNDMFLNGNSGIKNTFSNMKMIF